MFYPIFLGLILLCQQGLALELNSYLNIVEKNNLELSALNAEVKAISNEKLINATPQMPMVGLSRETMLMETDYAMISQELRFPLKYLYEAKLADHKQSIAELERESLKLNQRAQAKALYYSLFATQKTQELLEASQRTLRDYARVAK